MTCAFCGVLSGAAYDILYIARCAVCGLNVPAYTVKDKVFTIICDLLYCIIFAAMFVFVSVTFNFYELRFFMLAGCVIGAILYLKSFHLIVAFFVKKVYNNIKSKRKRSNGRRKKKQNSGGDNG